MREAPAGAVVRCAGCDEPLYELTGPILYGAVLEPEKLRRIHPDVPVPALGVLVLCPNDPAHSGGYVEVDGERWRTW